MPLNSSRSGSGRQRASSNQPSSQPAAPDLSQEQAGPRRSSLLLRVLAWLAGLAVTGIVAGIAVVVVVVATIYPKLPDISDLADYRPKLPLRVYSAEGALIGEFGEERRRLMPIEEIPQVMKHAILAAEDARFFQHSGVDYRGIARATLAYLRRYAHEVL